MSWLEALILGLIQGLTEFLPVSSSGHLELGKAILGIETEKDLSFTIAVHGATVLSTIVVFRKDLLDLFKGLFKFQWNEETSYISKIAVSMIPVGIVAVFFKDDVEALFDGNIGFVGAMLMITAVLLTFAYFFKSRQREIGFLDAFIIGIAQALAVMPGISRSGATIATGMLIGNRKDQIARFSFLMVLIPILGANTLDIMDGEFSKDSGVGITALITGFLAAFVSGWLACKWMVGLVKKGKILYFGIYCAIVGIVAIAFHFLA